MFWHPAVPQTIPVLITGERECRAGLPYTIEQIEFKEYVKGVLPNEWHPFWDEDAKKAGAIAIKNYAYSKYLVGAAIWDCDWSQVYDPSRRKDTTDQAVEDTWDWWIVDDGLPLRTFYNANDAGCFTQGENCMSQLGSQEMAEAGRSWKDILNYYYDGWLVEIPSHNQATNNRFRFVSQVAEGSQVYSNDCGSAAVKMVAQYYGVAGPETVDDIHLDMAKGDYPVNYVQLVAYLEDVYGLRTEVVATYAPIIWALDDNGFDVSEIKMIDNIPAEVPVIWIYATTYNHWVVRFQGWNYDPFNGVYPFSDTTLLRNIYRPDLGLGIIVYNEILD